MIKGWKPLSILEKSSILDFWLGFECASELQKVLIKTYLV